MLIRDIWVWVDFDPQNAGWWVATHVGATGVKLQSYGRTPWGVWRRTRNTMRAEGLL